MNQPIDKDRWIVDVRGQMQNMSTQQIVGGLISAQLKVNFRISRDGQTFRAICNEPFIEQAIKLLIERYTEEATKFTVQESDAVTDDKSGFHNVGKLTANIGDQLTHAQQLEEINAIVNTLRKILVDIVAKRKMVIDTTKPTFNDEELHPDDQNEYITEQSFWSRLGWERAAGIVIVLALIIGGYGKYRNKVAAENAAEQAKLALEASSLGEYEKALGIMRGIKDISQLDSSTLIEMAETHIQLKQFGEGAVTLEMALKNSKTPRLAARANALLGKIAMQNNDARSAAAYFEKSLTEDALFSTIYNLAVLRLDEKQYDEAERLFVKALGFADQDAGPVLLGLFETAYAQDLIPKPDVTEQTFPRLQKVEKLLIPKNYYDSAYSAEVTLARLVIASKLKNETDFESLGREFILTAQDDHTSKRTNHDIEARRTTWSHLSSWCQELLTADNKSATRNAIFAACTLRTLGATAALPYANYAVQQNPIDPAFNAQMAYVHLLNGQAQRAKDYLELPLPDGVRLSAFGKRTLDAAIKELNKATK